eukprot:CAMPEP_0171316870 /NCGR_PEP_ID=MMETSP0816-20121228/76373_1 /TAXON_ID=420281 /ORGANISM="Proboscia inermis, Strain CCAP1064/1" /LENGTH=94 /DNA_ID=CAMNT_0011809459 /DNA_START=330 /DNA_END=615 /DNA_ORIENTATION=+
MAAKATSFAPAISSRGRSTFDSDSSNVLWFLGLVSQLHRIYWVFIAGLVGLSVEGPNIAGKIREQIVQDVAAIQAQGGSEKSKYARWQVSGLFF